MATATKKVHAARSVARRVSDVPESASLQFLIDQDNGGDFHWEIAGATGERLAQSASFASYDDAVRAARRVHSGAGSARFEPRATEQRQLAAA